MKKKIYTVISLILLVILYAVMFGFSAQTGNESGGLSHLVSKRLVELADLFSTKEWTELEIDSKAAMIDFFVRKAAHFSEYAFLGYLEYGLAVLWLKHGRKRTFLTVAILILSGVLDEFHQLFVPGRYASFWDILIDTAGGLTGMLLFWIVYQITLRRKKRSGQSGG